ncbi:hypothetical protein HPP92_017216 [Vanilla planifolia]|uniref:Threonine dehydratase n=1 Tax=Vanilla planifolia TaxID=51239 RepID=A0A835UND7_VANPL|nr:hypothetical protein HPP92_017216 [Vanilla planifolia]
MESSAFSRPTRAQVEVVHPKICHRALLRPTLVVGCRARNSRVAFCYNASAAPLAAVSPSEATQEDVASFSSPSLSHTVAMPLKSVSTDSLQYESGYLGGISEKTAPPAEDGGSGMPSPMEYLTSMLSSRVYDVAVESPLHYAPKLSKRLGVDLWLKREDLQPVFSFKLRGAYNMMAKLTKEQLNRGVVCSSAGNHAQGVALSAQKLGCDAVIVMPVTTPEIKWRSVQGLGAKVVLKGDSYDEAQLFAKKIVENDDIIVGQGTVGLEIVRQNRGPIHAIFVPVGGGGLIAGIAAYIKCVCPEVKVIGVEPFDANAMALSLYHGERIMLEQVGGFADGVAVKVVGEETFCLCRSLVDGVVLVSRDAICASIKDMFEEKRSILEPAGALSLAGAEAYCRYYGLKGEKVVAITSGANMNFDRLRLVTELADVGRKCEAVLATSLVEEPGSFKHFCELVGQINITEFKYRYNSSKEQALVLYSVGVHTDSELEVMIKRMENARLKTINLTNNDLAKDHLRHLMGGRSNVKDELLCRFIFPERPGALMMFLNAFSPRWNITLFHYRSQGETGANVLVGLQVPTQDMAEFRSCANRLGYEYAFEMSNEAYRLLM